MVVEVLFELSWLSKRLLSLGLGNTDHSCHLVGHNCRQVAHSRHRACGDHQWVDQRLIRHPAVVRKALDVPQLILLAAD